MSAAFTAPAGNKPRETKEALIVPRGRLRLGFCLIFSCVVLVLASASFLFAGPPPQKKPISQGYFDFGTCIRYALMHSEMFLKDRLQVQVKSADLKDAHSDLWPSVNLLTTYYLSRATGDSGSPVQVSVTTGDWNPLLALFRIKSEKIFVDIAKLNHLLTITEGVGDMAKLFYQIDLTERQIRATGQTVALLRKKVEYGRNRGGQGSIDPLMVRGWSNDLTSQRVILRELQNDRESAIRKLKVLMGYEPDFYLRLDTRDSVNQVLRGFNGSMVSFADVQTRNLGLKIIAKKEQAQSNVVSGSYVKLLPQPKFILEGLSNQVDRTSGVNMQVGLIYSLWDGFKRVRDIKRNKLKAEGLKYDRRLESRKLYNTFLDLKDAIELSNAKEDEERAKFGLAELTEERAFENYKSGGVPYEDYVEARIRKMQASLAAIASSKDRVVSLIELATIAGGLDKYNAGIRY